jgi:glycosyltransferase involved in cell wall biosynthesis
VTPFVSVVIATHNRRELLLRTLHSVLAQKDVGFEVVVVDDGSDGAAQAVRLLNDRRVLVIRQEQPVAVSVARNIGAKAATGSWIALLDDDDLWSPEKLQRQLNSADATGRTWVYAGAVEIDAGGRLLGGEPPPSSEYLLDTLLERNLMPAGCSNVIIRTKLFQQVGGFDVELRHLADWDLWLRLARTDVPACVDAPLVAYRQHGSQMTLNTAGIMAEAGVLARRHGTDVNSIRRWMAWSYLRRGDRRLAARAYADAVLAGNVSSLGRAVVALLHPQPTVLRRARPESDPWCRNAEHWLRSLATK